MNIRLPIALTLVAAAVIAGPVAQGQDSDRDLTIHWAKSTLTIHGDHIPGGKLEIWYLEAYCRPGSTDREWGKTTIGHDTRLIEASDDKKQIKLQCKLHDGVIVDHVIRAGTDEVDFRLQAHNPTQEASLAHWAQPCIRVAEFTGVPQERNSEKYLPKSFIFLDNKLTRLPTKPWAKQARYVPGQVWCPRHVDRNDVNPRPLSPLVPSNGLIGCYSGDDKFIMATAWEPYQELFQGIICCLHNDFRIGGLKSGETKQIRGKVYIVPADADALITRYYKDFPEHRPDGKK